MSTPVSAAPSTPRVGDIEDFLYDAVHTLTPDLRSPVGRGRPRMLPALCLWAGLLVCVARGLSSQTDLWRLLTQQGLWEYPRFPVSDQAVCDRLADGGTAPMEHLFARITATLAPRLAPAAETALAPFATEVVALDGSDLDRMARLLPSLRALPAGDARLLGGTLAGVFDPRTQHWRQIAYRTDSTQNEKVAARALIADLAPGALIVADLGCFGFRWFDDLTDATQWWVSRLRAGTSDDVLHTISHHGDTFDGIVWLGKHRADRAKHAVRLVRFRVGAHLHAYVTNVRDPKVAPMAEIARIYGRRWDCELAIELVKRESGLHLLWSTKPVVIAQQLFAALCIAQIPHALRCEVAQRAGVEIFDVSLPLLVRWMPRFAAQGDDPVAIFVEQGKAAGFIRPSRRVRHDAPRLPDSGLTPLPSGTILVRTPRYAQRECHSRKGKGI